MSIISLLYIYALAHTFNVLFWHKIESLPIQMDHIVPQVCKVLAIISISHDYVKLSIVADFRYTVIFSSVKSK